MQMITISLPDHLYEKVKAQSQHNQREIGEELVAVVSVALPIAIEEALAELSFLNDEALWQAARTAATAEENERMQVLIAKQERLGLTTAETEELSLLANFFRRIMLIRAEAAVLLKERGYDIHHLYE